MNQTKIINNVVDGGPTLRLPGHMSLGQHVIDSLRANSENDDVALINGDTGEKTKFSQVLQGTVSAAAGLAKLGLRRGDTAALCGENRVEYLHAALGAICCGATVTTMNLMYTKDELLHALTLSRPRFVFASQIAMSLHLETLQSFPSVEKIIQIDGDEAAAAGVVLLRQVALEADARDYEAAPVEPQDTAFILYSSGTTGLPKGVMLSHKNMLYSIALFELRGFAHEKTSLLSIVPWFHAYGLMSTINYLIVRNLLVYFSGGFDPQKYLQTIQDYKKLPVRIRSLFEERYGKDQAKLPTLDQLMELLDEQCRLHLTITENETRSLPARRRTPHQQSDATPGPTSQRHSHQVTSKSTECTYCNSSFHSLYVCRKFNALHPKARKSWVFKSGHCFKCLRKHYASECTHRNWCKHCGSKDHNSLLCVNERQSSSIAGSQETSTQSQVQPTPSMDHRSESGTVSQAQSRNHQVRQQSPTNQVQEKPYHNNQESIRAGERVARAQLKFQELRFGCRRSPDQFE